MNDKTVKVVVWLSCIVAAAVMVAGTLFYSEVQAAPRHAMGFVKPLGWENAAEWEGISGLDVQPLPSRWNWNDHIPRQPARNQGNCGSCVAFATTSVTESLEVALHPNTQYLNLSEQSIVSCSGVVTCAGGYFTAFNYVRDKGLPVEASFPYVARDVSCRRVPAVSRVTRWAYIGVRGRAPTQAELKAAIHKHGPIEVDINGSGSFQNHVGAGVFTACGSSSTNHAIVLLGWQDDSRVQGGGYWIIRNSWGTSWGDKGYAKIAYKNSSGRSCNGIGSIGVFAIMDGVEDLQTHMRL